MKLVRLIIEKLSKVIDVKKGAISALIMSVIIFIINYSSGADILLPAAAAFKQGIYTFFLGGGLLKSCEYLATHIKKTQIAIVTSVIIPSAVTILLTFALHSYKGTPKPLASTVPTFVAIPVALMYSLKKRKNYEKISTQLFETEDADCVSAC